MRYLAKNKKDYIGKCRYCGAPLPVGSTFMVCDRCYPGDEAPPGIVQRGADLPENSLIFHNFLLAIYAMGVIMHL